MANINLRNLNVEMHYQPGWYSDKDLFLNLLNTSALDIQDMLILARLYIKYQPILNKYKLLYSCFQYLLGKVNCSKIDDLYLITRNQYTK
jgi:hypothetical protein